jgi:hypothetical protein
MPPSTSMGAALLPARSSSMRISSTLDVLLAIKVCPPNPGLTDMMSTKSTSAATFSIEVTVVEGLSTTPALTPRARMA